MKSVQSSDDACEYQVLLNYPEQVRCYGLLVRAFRVGHWRSDHFILSCIVYFFPQTWMKFSSLPRHSWGGILQLVGCCRTSAVHAVGGHISPVSGGRVILRILVLAKCCVWGIILQETHISCECTRLQRKKKNKDASQKPHFWSSLSNS